jgi:hypothetical protein
VVKRGWSIRNEIYRKSQKGLDDAWGTVEQADGEPSESGKVN